MDKRSLIFIVCISLAFFGLNFYFSKQRDEQNRQILKQQEEQQKKDSFLAKEELKKRKIPLSSLPIVSLYADANSSQFLIQGIAVKENILVLGWKDHLPETIYLKGKAKTLVTKESVKGGLALYISEPFESLQIASLPKEGKFDLQLVTLDGAGNLQNFLGEYIDGEFTPLEEIPGNAIALYETSSGYYPLGFYESLGNVFIELQNLPLLEKFHEKTEISDFIAPKNEQFYVLENDYQQLVFSNVGASITEINLPFASKKDSVSVVKEINFDKKILKESPKNALFPLPPYLIAGQKTEQEGKEGGYYPLLRRNLKSEEHALSPEFYAFNIVSSYPEMAELVFTVTDFTDTAITFEAVQPHRKIIKTYTLAKTDKAAPYVFDLEISIQGDRRGLFLTSGVTEVELMSNNSSPEILYRISKNEKTQVQKLDLPKAGQTINVSSITPDWVVNSNGYLGIIIDPLNRLSQGFKAKSINGKEIPTRLSLIDAPYYPYPSSKYPGYELFIPLEKTTGALHFRIYAGPFEESVLKKVDATYSNTQTGYNPQYISSRTFHGWFKFIAAPFSRFLFVVMKFCYSITHSWGFSIILLTIFLRILLYPLNTWSIKSMRRMQEIAPEIKSLQKKYKKDPKRAQLEIMSLYREKKVNPFLGCVPLLIQFPFLIAMFDLLKSSFQLRGASFIPGWIDDLTAPDVIFSWKEPIFFIGNQLHLLPFILGAIMLLQQWMSAQATKGVELTDQQRQQRAMGTVMCIVFTIMFYHFPSGLNIYWISSMSLGILQQWITNKVLDKKKKEKKTLQRKKT